MDQVILDSLLPSEMASNAESLGVAKAKMPLSKMFVLSVLAGAFIAFGSVFFTTVTTASTMSYGVTRLLGGLSFSLGLVLVIVGGAELFTGNNLIIMAWANKKVSTLQILKNWCMVFLGNFIGALFIVVLMLLSRQFLSASGMVGMNIVNIAKVKCELGFTQAMALGVLCNILVCLAVWLCYSSRSISGKIISIVFPITAFVTCGFEHSIANMYFIPKAIMMMKLQDPAMVALIEQSGVNYDSITWSNFLFNNLLPVTIGNIIGGAVLVGLVYWFVYLRSKKVQISFSSDEELIKPTEHVIFKNTAGVTGTDEVIAAKPSFNVSPNPVRDEAVVSFNNLVPGSYRLVMQDEHGRIMQQKSLVISSSNPEQLNLSQLQPGMYVLTLFDESNRLLCQEELIKGGG